MPSIFSLFCFVNFSDLLSRIRLASTSNSWVNFSCSFSTSTFCSLSFCSKFLNSVLLVASSTSSKFFSFRIASRSVTVISNRSCNFSSCVLDSLRRSSILLVSDLLFKRAIKFPIKAPIDSDIAARSKKRKVSFIINTIRRVL